MMSEWKLVPVEPTQAMLDAAWNPARGAKSMWHDMLSAAPEPSEAEVEAALRAATASKGSA